MMFFPRVPVGMRPSHHPRSTFNSGFYSPFQRGYGRPVIVNSYRPCFPRPFFPGFSLNYAPYHFQATPFHSISESIFSLSVTLAALAAGILLCALL